MEKIAGTLQALGMHSLHTLCAALPDPAMASKSGVSREDVQAVVDGLRDAECGRLSLSATAQCLRRGSALLAPAWAKFGGTPSEVLKEISSAVEKLELADSGASCAGLTRMMDSGTKFR